jgi:hypothetical protein
MISFSRDNDMGYVGWHNQMEAQVENHFVNTIFKKMGIPYERKK